MYKVRKDMYSTSNVFVENTDTLASINIGRITIKVLEILADEGYKTDCSLNVRDTWDLDISAEAASKLSKLAMPMKKPIRDQRKVTVENEQPEDNKHVDAMDVMLGLASYIKK